MIEAPQPLPGPHADENEQAVAVLSERENRVHSPISSSPRWVACSTRSRRVGHLTVEHSAAAIRGMMLTELLTHGLDLATALEEQSCESRPTGVRERSCTLFTRRALIR
jgi:hypothetical protein